MAANPPQNPDPADSNKIPEHSEDVNNSAEVLADQPLEKSEAIDETIESFHKKLLAWSNKADEVGNEFVPVVEAAHERQQLIKQLGTTQIKDAEGADTNKKALRHINRFFFPEGYVGSPLLVEIIKLGERVKHLQDTEAIHDELEKIARTKTYQRLIAMKKLPVEDFSIAGQTLIALKIACVRVLRENREDSTALTMFSAIREFYQNNDYGSHVGTLEEELRVIKTSETRYGGMPTYFQPLHRPNNFQFTAKLVDFLRSQENATEGTDEAAQKYEEKLTDPELKKYPMSRMNLESILYPKAFGQLRSPTNDFFVSEVLLPTADGFFEPKPMPNSGESVVILRGGTGPNDVILPKGVVDDLLLPVGAELFRHKALGERELNLPFDGFSAFRQRIDISASQGAEYSCEVPERYFLSPESIQDICPTSEEQTYLAKHWPLPKSLRQQILNSPNDALFLVLQHFTENFQYACNDHLGDFLLEHKEELSFLLDELKVGHCSALSLISMAYLRQLGFPVVAVSGFGTTGDGLALNRTGHIKLYNVSEEGLPQEIDLTRGVKFDDHFTNDDFPVDAFNEFKENYNKAQTVEEKRALLQKMKRDIHEYKADDHYRKETLTITPGVSQRSFLRGNPVPKDRFYRLVDGKMNLDSWKAHKYLDEGHAIIHEIHGHYSWQTFGDMMRDIRDADEMHSHYDLTIQNFDNFLRRVSEIDLNFWYFDHYYHDRTGRDDNRYYNFSRFSLNNPYIDSAEGTKASKALHHDFKFEDIHYAMGSETSAHQLPVDFHMPTLLARRHFIDGIDPNFTFSNDFLRFISQFMDSSQARRIDFDALFNPALPPHVNGHVEDDLRYFSMCLRLGMTDERYRNSLTKRLYVDEGIFDDFRRHLFQPDRVPKKVLKGNNRKKRLQADKNLVDKILDDDQTVFLETMTFDPAIQGHNIRAMREYLLNCLPKKKKFRSREVEPMTEVRKYEEGEDSRYIHAITTQRLEETYVKPLMTSSEEPPFLEIFVDATNHDEFSNFSKLHALVTAVQFLTQQEDVKIHLSVPGSNVKFEFDRNSQPLDPRLLAMWLHEEMYENDSNKAPGNRWENINDAEIVKKLRKPFMPAVDSDRKTTTVFLTASEGTAEMIGSKFSGNRNFHIASLSNLGLRSATRLKTGPMQAAAE